jgi:hypothetical protein
MRRPLLFKLTQQHTNNWEADKLLNLATNFPPIDVQPPRYGQIYNILLSHKHFNVTIANYLGYSRIYFIVMLVASLGGCGAWVQC